MQILDCRDKKGCKQCPGKFHFTRAMSFHNTKPGSVVKIYCNSDLLISSLMFNLVSIVKVRSRGSKTINSKITLPNKKIEHNFYLEPEVTSYN